MLIHTTPEELKTDKAKLIVSLRSGKPEDIARLHSYASLTSRRIRFIDENFSRRGRIHNKLWHSYILVVADQIILDSHDDLKALQNLLSNESFTILRDNT